MDSGLGRLQAEVKSIDEEDAAPDEGGKHAGTLADLDVTKFGMRDGLPYLKVKGRAGGTIPPADSTDIYAYVFVTDAGIFAVASHTFFDSEEQQGPGDETWHAHMVTLDSNNCISSINDVGTTFLTNKRVFLVDSGATSVSSVLTARLTVSGSSVCVAEVFDSE